MTNAPKTAIGLMSGTSMDGIDVAMLVTDGEQLMKVGPSASFDYSTHQRELLLAGLKDAELISIRTDRPHDLDELEKAVTDWHCEAVENFMQENDLSADDVDVVGFHGQTVLHRPEQGLTVQLGLGQRMANRVGIDVVYDFRANDMEHGGQGAPLVPVYHQSLATNGDAELPVVLLNIGGISNVTYVGSEGELLGFDSGPGNGLIDQWMLSEAGIPYDQGGRIASEGQIDQSIVDRYLAAPYFSQAAPKSLDRSDFPPMESGELELADGARTLAHITARSIAKSQEQFPTQPKHWIISGGGRLNDSIIRELREIVERKGQQLSVSEDIGLNGDMMEAEAFAYLAVRSMRGLALTFPSTTGCKKPVSGGVWVRPD